MKITHTIICMALTGTVSAASVDFTAAGEFDYGKVAVSGDAIIGKSPAGTAVFTGQKGKNGSVKFSPKEFNPKSGAISFWVSPVKWNANDGKFHIFLTATAENGKDDFTIYRYGNKDANSNGLGILFMQNVKSAEPAKRTIINLPNSKVGDSWTPGSWHYIVLNFSEKNITFYLDGEHIGSSSAALGIGSKPTFSLGGSWGEKAETAIAGFAVNSKPMTAEEISSAYDSVMSKLHGE